MNALNDSTTRGVLLTLVAVTSTIALITASKCFLSLRARRVLKNQRRKLFQTELDARKNREEAEDDILKIGFSSKKVLQAGEDSSYDAVIIGSGIGGLTTASLLAQQGHRVLVLEQHDMAGGNMHTFEDHGFQFDTGIHYIGGYIADPRSSMAKLVGNISDPKTCVKWNKMEEHFDVSGIYQKGGLLGQFRVNSSMKTIEKDLIERFPEERAAIVKYFNLLRSVARDSAMYFSLALFPRWLAMPIYKVLRVIFPHVATAIDCTTEEVLAKLTSNTELRGILGYMYGNAGPAPFRASFLHYAVVFCHYRGGGHYPIGGSSEIARPIVQKILDCGGKVLVRAPVSEILIDPETHAACGVRVKGVTVKSKYVISGAGAVNTYKRLIPEAHRGAVAKQVEFIDKIIPKTSLLSLFVGIEDSDAEEGKKLLPAHNYWIFPSWDHTKNVTDFENDISKPIAAVFISFPSAKDPKFAEHYPGKHVAEVICPAEYSWFEKYRDLRVKHRGDEYQKLKDEIRDRLLEVLLAAAPQLKDKIVFTDVGTPVTNDFYLGTLKGECYGVEHVPKRFSSPLMMGPRTPIENLYLTGQDVATNGFGGALIGGYFAAATVDFTVVLDHFSNLA